MKVFTLAEILKLLSAGGYGGISHFVDNPEISIADDAQELWAVYSEHVRAEAKLNALMNAKYGGAR